MLPETFGRLHAVEPAPLIARTKKLHALGAVPTVARRIHLTEELLEMPRKGFPKCLKIAARVPVSALNVSNRQQPWWLDKQKFGIGRH
jgi:hypothetical protein